MTPQDTDLNWISFKELRKKKMCQMCRKPMAVKQINMTEACRACFNEECCSQLMDLPDIEYIQRSYRDMGLEGKKQGFLIVPVSLENEVDNVKTLFSEVENMVSHRLGKEYWNEMKSPICSKKQAEDSKSLNLSDKLLCDESEWLDSFLENYSKNLKTEDAPMLHLEESVFCNGISINVGLPNIPPSGEQPLEQSWNPLTENLNTIHSEQSHASDAVWDNVQPTHKKECEQLPDLPVSVFDPAPNEIRQCVSGTEVVNVDLGKDLPACDTMPDFESSNDYILSEVDIKDNLQESNNHSQAYVILNIESKSSDILEDKTSSKLVQAKDDKTQISFTRQDEGSRSVDAVVDEDFNFNVLTTNGLRCYRPRKRLHRTAKAETETKTFENCILLEKWSSISVNSELDPSSTHLDVPIEKKENFELFKDIDADFQKSSLQHSDVSVVHPLDQVIELEGQVIFPEKNDCTKSNGLPQSLKEDMNVNVPLKDESSDTLTSAEPLTCDPTKNIKSCPKEKKEQPKPGKNDLGSSAKASVTDGPKGNAKPTRGFYELKNFGGVKSSLLSEEAESKTKSKTKSKTRKKTTNSDKIKTNSVNDDIEKAIADVQQSSGDPNVEWDQMFFDILN